LLFVLAFLRWKQCPVFVAVLFLLIPALVSIIMIDWNYGIIPNVLILWLGSVGICTAIVNPLFVCSGLPIWRMFLNSAVGSAAGFSILLAVRSLGNYAYRKESMGLGDVKLFGAIGFLIGWIGVLWVIFLSSAAAAIVGIIFHLKNGRKEIPYGPFIASTGLAYLLTFPWKLW
jgi:leader peptidase (prepilin peptidase)/N-methyltransferase